MKNFILKIFFTIGCVFILDFTLAQETTPVNGVQDNRHTTFALTNARIYIDYKTVLDNATLIVKDGRVLDVSTSITVPKGAITIDLKGKTIYPSFIEPYSDYGIAELKSEPKEGRQQQFLSNTKGAYGWNQAVRPEIDAVKYFSTDAKKAESLRNIGFGAALSLKKDGIIRGSGTVVLLADQNEDFLIIKDRAAACFSFDKGSSTQDYPGSLMGCIALIRQTYYDAQWYKTNQKEFNISLDAFNKLQQLPQIFDVRDKLDALRAGKIGSEFGVKYIIKGSGNEYQRINELKNSGSNFIVPVNFPEAYDVSDPQDAINIMVSEMKNWEMAPANAAWLEKAGINFAFTADGLKDKNSFLNNIRKAVQSGLSEETALRALTAMPAEMLNVSDKIGSLKKGMIANFIITDKSIFDKECVLFENWCNGIRYAIKNIDVKDVRGNYSLNINNLKVAVLKISGEPVSLKLNILEDTSKISGNISESVGQYLINYESKKAATKGIIKLDGYYDESTKSIKGNGLLANGNWITWIATYDSAFIVAPKKDTTKIEKITMGDLWFPNMAFGNKEILKQKNVLIKNVTVWTNEEQGILKNTDVLIKEGKISAIGKDLAAGDALIVDGTGKHLSAGIIDEHSHIAISGNVNECTQSVTAEVRIADVVDCDDVNIYRQLAGGVTSSHLLHGSCNPIGGQSQLIKLRWGLAPEEMKFANWPGFIKFALGENVKQSNWGEDNNSRYPQTRMGVEQTYMNAFTRAREYEAKMNGYQTLSAKVKSATQAPRRDLELDALVEILNSKRFITCHSYVQSEINMLMHVADSFHFRVNTFTHILEGYKVADKMKKHGVGASSFSDWWAYKFEVYEAIPYNGKILHDVGVTVAYNSDDAEMARRLNQEAGKAVTYGNVNEEEALKFVTLNPAKLLHVDDRVGSIKVGKDADVVLWTDNPLSIYSKVVQTYVDGICYFDVETDKKKREELAIERARLIQKMTDAKSKGEKTQKPMFNYVSEKHCNDEEHAPKVD